MDPVNSWAGEPEVTLVSEDGTEVKVHRIFLALYTDQWRQTLQGLQISQLVLLLQDVDGGELEEIVSGIYRSFIVREDTKDIQDSEAVEKENTIEATAENDGESHVEGGYIVNDTNDDTIDNIEDIEEVICLDDNNDGDDESMVEASHKAETSNKDTEKDTKEKDKTINQDDYDDDVDLTRGRDIINNDTGNDRDSDEGYTINEGDSEDVDEIEKNFNHKVNNSKYHSQSGEYLNGKSVTADDKFTDEISKTDNTVDIKEQVKSKMKKYKKEGNTWYACQLCDHDLKDLKNIKNHIESKHLGVKYPCNQCDKVCNTKSTLRNHKIYSHGEQRSVILKKCEYCAFTANTRINVIRHTNNVHLNLKPFQCKLCDNKYHTKVQLQLHIKSVHDQIKDFCDICSKYFKSIIAHRRREHKERVCQYCSETFTKETHYINHLKNIHGIFKEKDILRCPSCDYTTREKELLRQHDQTNHNITYIYCDQCEYKTKHIRHLKQHQKEKHDSSFKKLECDYCDFTATKKFIITQHQQSKHENLRFPCDQCLYQATRKGSLMKHIQTVHEGRK